MATLEDVQAKNQSAHVLPPTEVIQAPRTFGGRVLLIYVVTFLYIFSSAVQSSLSVQFIFYLVESDHNDSSVSNISVCETDENSSRYNDLEHVEEKAAEIQIFLSVATGVPSVIMCLVFGSLSDRMGRRFLFALPVCGIMIRAAAYAVVSHWTLSLYYLLIGHLLEGFSGGFSCFLLGAFAGSSDITSEGRRRSFLIAIIEASAILSAGVGSLVLGYMIQGCGYTYPNLLVIAISVINFVTIKMALPETKPETPKEKLRFTAFASAVKRVFRIYFVKDKGLIRCKLILCWTAFFITSITYIGSIGVETLYVKNRPLCWDSIKIGYFGSIKSVCSALAATFVIRLMQCCLGDIGIAVTCGLAKIASFVLQGFADTDLKMYAVAVVGMPGIGLMAMTRSIMSKSTAPENIGSMFASVACAEAATTITGGVLFNAIYKSTIHEEHGIVFFVMAAILGVVLFIYGGIYWVTRVSSLPAKAILRADETTALLPNEKSMTTK
ncbi:lysosomal proton-coupled steroid conjugate and bile acid symporter SLC46A3-like [Liolophura sinensis]|uniref:lysosomal proton-coupled steroid conjugate and bile acid symporter SLC46A3-like n=1 Tax=Liolophura sinensis TaxID=3198878 RepID=UPI003158237B